MFQTKSFSPDRASLVPEVLISSPGGVQSGVLLLCWALKSRVSLVPVQRGKSSQSFHVYLSIFTQALQWSFRNRQVHFCPKLRTVLVPLPK